MALQADMGKSGTQQQAFWNSIVVVKKKFRFSNVFLTTIYAAIPCFGTY